MEVLFSKKIKKALANAESRRAVAESITRSSTDANAQAPRPTIVIDGTKYNLVFGPARTIKK